MNLVEWLIVTAVWDLYERSPLIGGGPWKSSVWRAASDVLDEEARRS